MKEQLAALQIIYDEVFLPFCKTAVEVLSSQRIIIYPDELAFYVIPSLQR